MFSGKQEERNYEKGIKVVIRLASHGHIPAVCQLGIAYFDHIGVRRNYSEAFRLYTEAAKEGYPSAECEVGNFFAMAYPKYIVLVNIVLIRQFLWLEASNHANAPAQYNLAIICREQVWRKIRLKPMFGLHWQFTAQPSDFVRLKMSKFRQFPCWTKSLG